MNEVETYLRTHGGWSNPINTDRRGRAIQGTWWQRYYAQWLDAHGDRRGDRRDQLALSPGGWVPDQNRDDWWATTTPEWDRNWFHQNGVKPPERFMDKADTHWEDHGNGLSQLSCHSDRPGFWARLRAWLGVGERKAR